MVANAIVHLAFGYITTLTVDFAFLIVGQTKPEFPKRILGAVRFFELNTALARQIELHSQKSMEASPNLLSQVVKKMSPTPMRHMSKGMLTTKVLTSDKL
ncbi:Hypothetical predicted protein [Olea europaea subsp. europaea]|uniref:Protein ENHANCED DISEASE RESISTANCE 2 C-terminal domain-containing protein n=1 Tax=Olea europaea subsp. europaea TaxID=158383 RepID=A0A8S0PN89_OLEEU|nr:Hypothetical predicted protein [Olea europaea subsp. europaea]